MNDIKENTWKYGSMKLLQMTYTFRCDNEKCKKSIICLMSKYDGSEYFSKCSYCGNGRMKWIENIDLMGVLKEHMIIQTKRV